MKSGMEEEWRKVPDLPWYYEVSNFGRIKSLARIDGRGWKRKTKILKQSKSADFSAALEDGTSRWCAVAAMVLKAFVGPAPEGMRCSRHLDDDRTNNNILNLAWGSDLDNINDAIRNGRNFASYGRLGKPHRQETKDLLSKLQKGKPTGRKMSPQHKAAMLAGYRRKFPEKQITNECYGKFRTW